MNYECNRQAHLVGKFCNCVLNNEPSRLERVVHFLLKTQFRLKAVGLASEDDFEIRKKPVAMLN